MAPEDVWEMIGYLVSAGVLRPHHVSYMDDFECNEQGSLLLSMLIQLGAGPCTTFFEIIRERRPEWTVLFHPDGKKIPAIHSK